MLIRPERSLTGEPPADGVERGPQALARTTCVAKLAARRAGERDHATAAARRRLPRTDGAGAHASAARSSARARRCAPRVSRGSRRVAAEPRSRQAIEHAAIDERDGRPRAHAARSSIAVGAAISDAARRELAGRADHQNQGITKRVFGSPALPPVLSLRASSPSMLSRSPSIGAAAARRSARGRRRTSPSRRRRDRSRATRARRCRRSASTSRRRVGGSARVADRDARRDALAAQQRTPSRARSGRSSRASRRTGTWRSDRCRPAVFC